ncbi:hypothetical protein A2W14_06570 [Candidatus Gottesmanbacteria bacterium RBG_16_37_8]|uniref:SpoVT-AbrB domain-containing protein n=1 Tax=Candidatus Gottesmanbacteria bacterium RBG_16_37_8 TaxID=1798371 RepID=A0A1F5YPY3_9BACT|nr:MAG: hypothetical protein A2W14_06570 [Candidatus Gottesmanbacteria bacterium RBG_16_37_8]
MKIGTIIYSNEKGQIVIPKNIRNSIGIDKNVPLNVIERGNGIFIYPIEEIRTKADTNESFYRLLEKTRGAWAGDDWPETAKKRRKIELAASRRRKKVIW